MQDGEITNKDLMYHIEDIKDKVTTITTKDLPEINARVKTTNGSVADIKAWKERMTGAGFVILLVVIPIMSWALYQIVALNNKISNVDSQIKTGLSEALRDYEDNK